MAAMSDPQETSILTLLRRHAEACTGRIVVGYSGGLDSTVLLSALVRAGLANKVLAVHVHHGLSERAEAWQSHCQNTCEKLGVEFIAAAAELLERDNLEARARDARRRLLIEQVAEHDQLWLAHHQNDQAETLLLRLLRGAGTRGLAGMATQRQWRGVTLLRPLLNVSRAALEQLAALWQLDWVEDDSNQSERFSRNYLRHRVLPLLTARWPATTERFAAASERLSDDAELLNYLADEDFATCGGREETLLIPAFRRLTAARQRNLLRGWLHRADVQPPSATVLQRVLDEILSAQADREPRVEWPGGVFTRFRDHLYLLPEGALDPVKQPVHWGVAQQDIVFGPLHLRGVQQRDRVPREIDDALRFSLSSIQQKGPMQLRPAVGGERLLWRGMHRQVSELWRQAAIPPWQRRQLPLFYLGEQLVAVAEIGVADDWLPQAEESVWRVTISRSGGQFPIL